MSDGRPARLLVPDGTPLLLLLGGDALDRLFEIGAEVWITGQAVAGTLREPDPCADTRRDQRRELRTWLGSTSHRILVQKTQKRRDHERKMRNWTAA